MGVYDSDITMVEEEIDLWGRSVTYRQVRNSNDPPDTSKPWKPAEPVTTDYPVNILFLQATDEWAMYLPDTEIRTGATVGLLKGNVDFIIDTDVPILKDVVINSDGKQLDISSIDKIKPGEQTVMYFIQFTE